MEKFDNAALPALLNNILFRDYNISDKVASKAAENFKETLSFAGLLNNGVLTSSSINKFNKPESNKEIKPSPKQSPSSSLDLEDYIPINLPSGILIYFPAGMSYRVSIGEFATELQNLEKKAKGDGNKADIAVPKEK